MPRFTFRAVALLIASLPATASAQHYQRHWNTAVVAAPIRVFSGLRPSVLPGLPDDQPAARRQSGLASFYWQGQTTASGERFDKSALTAAHRTLPLQTRVKVTHVASGRTVVVRINDRGPFKPGRIIDLSDRAAEVLGFKPQGLAQVQLEVVP